MVGLMATGGSTNLVIHLPAMARAAGITLDLADFHDISAAVPLMARVSPNGLADVNHFHACGGVPFMVRTLLDAAAWQYLSQCRADALRKLSQGIHLRHCAT